eukprot:1381094-Pleurochrysis_carterae.AAC.2
MKQKTIDEILKDESEGTTLSTRRDLTAQDALKDRNTSEWMIFWHNRGKHSRNLSLNLVLAPKLPKGCKLRRSARAREPRWRDFCAWRPGCTTAPFGCCRSWRAREDVQDDVEHPRLAVAAGGFVEEVRQVDGSCSHTEGRVLLGSIIVRGRGQVECLAPTSIGIIHLQDEEQSAAQGRAVLLVHQLLQGDPVGVCGRTRKFKLCCAPKLHPRAAAASSTSNSHALVDLALANQPDKAGKPGCNAAGALLVAKYHASAQGPLEPFVHAGAVLADQGDPHAISRIEIADAPCGEVVQVAAYGLLVHLRQQCYHVAFVAENQ